MLILCGRCRHVPAAWLSASNKMTAVELISYDVDAFTRHVFTHIH